MIEVKYSLGAPLGMGENEKMSLSVRGHAGYTEPGRDIVCAAASILFQTFAEWIDAQYRAGMIRDPPEIVQEKGGGSVVFTPPEEARLRMRSNLGMIAGGYRMLEAEYPSNVTVSEG